MLVHQGQNDVVLNRHMRGYHLETSEFPWPAPHPSLPSAPVSPICPTRSQQQHKHKPLLISHDNLLVHEREVLLTSGTYHSTSIIIYHLSIAHLVDKHKYFYNKDNIRKGTTMQPIIILSKNSTRSV
jgi:hypothetical protein